MLNNNNKDDDEEGEMLAGCLTSQQHASVPKERFYYVLPS